jgi:hypothetical protein
MGNMKIKYCFRLPDSTEEVFNLELDAESVELVNNMSKSSPEWARLDFHQCPNCPLSKQAHPNCPLMLNLVDIVSRFDHILSYDEINMEVFTEERCISSCTTAQRGLSSLMGVVIGSSGCPHTVCFKPMVRFHLPLSSEEETIYRAASMYLLAQYFLKKKGRRADFELIGLEEIYKNIHIVNATIAKRLRAASKTDLSVNAIIMLDMYAKAMPYAIEESLEEIQYLFTSYLERV